MLIFEDYNYCCNCRNHTITRITKGATGATGLYLMGYHIKTCDLTNMKVRVTKNDNLLPNTICSSTLALNDYNITTLVQLNEGDKLQLQCYDLDNEEVSIHGEMSSSFWLVRVL